MGSGLVRARFRARHEPPIVNADINPIAVLADLLNHGSNPLQGLFRRSSITLLQATVAPGIVLEGGQPNASLPTARLTGAA